MTDIRKLFKPEQFKYIRVEVDPVIARLDAAEVAQSVLTTYLDEHAVYVEGKKSWNGALEMSELFNCDLKDDRTHRALLINIKPIEKKECAHEPIAIIKSIKGGIEYSTAGLAKITECKKCGLPLEAEWKVRK